MTQQAPQLGRLLLPALRAVMGDWVYYISYMRMCDISERISVAEEIHTSNSLNEFIQRELQRSTRVAKITDYLLTQPQRLFNSLVVGVYGGAPQWYELAIKENELLDPDVLPGYLGGVLGILILEGSEKLFAIDGQHRVVGIRDAVKAAPELGKEEVGIILVGHKNDQEGLKRTRRLFTTLNRYAKPVGKHEIIALDEDDVVAITTRHLAEEHPLFKDRMSAAKGKNIPTSDRSSLTTIVTLYDALDVILRDRHRGWASYKQIRPSEDEIAQCYGKAVGFFDAMVPCFPPLQRLKDSDPSSQPASEYRSRNGGHLLFRPIGMLLVVRAARFLTDCGMAQQQALASVSKVPMDIARRPWVNLLWDPGNKRMVTAATHQKAALKLLVHAIGGDLSLMRSSEEDLRRELAGLLNVEAERVELPQYL